MSKQVSDLRTEMANCIAEFKSRLKQKDAEIQGFKEHSNEIQRSEQQQRKILKEKLAKDGETISQSVIQLSIVCLLIEHSVRKRLKPSNATLQCLISVDRH
jgi:Sec-independent protein translocase protein TatA